MSLFLLIQFLNTLINTIHFQIFEVLDYFFYLKLGGDIKFFFLNEIPAFLLSIILADIYFFKYAGLKM